MASARSLFLAGTTQQHHPVSRSQVVSGDLLLLIDGWTNVIFNIMVLRPQYCLSLRHFSPQIDEVMGLFVCFEDNIIIIT